MGSEQKSVFVGGFEVEYKNDLLYKVNGRKVQIYSPMEVRRLDIQEIGLSIALKRSDVAGIYIGRCTDGMTDYFIYKKQSK